jgi:CubicO group peptidase (beta-lactamase class C family)
VPPLPSRLSLQPIGAFLPDIPPDKAQITTRHPLNHTSGLADIVDADSQPTRYTPDFAYQPMGPAGSNEIFDACYLWYLDEHRVIVMLTSSSRFRAEELVPDLARRMTSVRAS